MTIEEIKNILDNKPNWGCFGDIPEYIELKHCWYYCRPSRIYIEINRHVLNYYIDFKYNVKTCIPESLHNRFDKHIKIKDLTIDDFYKIIQTIEQNYKKCIIDFKLKNINKDFK